MEKENLKSVLAPQGTVTFVFTDIVGSTRLWERFPQSMADAVREHDQLLREIFSNHGGYVFKTVGDAFCVAFADPSLALRAAAETHRTLSKKNWGEPGPLEVRIGVHTGAAEFREGDYFGGSLNRTARIEAAAYGGQTLVSGVTRALSLDDLEAGCYFRDLGEHRLKGLERPEQLFQFGGPGLLEDFPPPRTLSAYRHNLPVLTTSFIGREIELAQAVEKLTGPARILTLTGTGGTGKTRLSIELGHRLLDKFPDGVWQVELALVTDTAHLPGVLIAAMGLREEPDRAPLQTLNDALQKQNALLILDNCEHLTHGVATLAAQLLKNCSQLRLLATSRSALGLAGEFTMPIPPLPIFDYHRERLEERGLVSSLRENLAVRLFIDRAQTVQPDFDLTPSNAKAVAQICSRLDGIPLALELAAARLRVLDVEQISRRLADRFRLLKSSDQQRLPHQQTLQALVDWSYDLLEPVEKVLFRRLGVFTGGRTLEAIEAVCGDEVLTDWEIIDVLQSLIDKSLVNVEAGESGERRYTMIESVWHYSRAVLKGSGEEEKMQEAQARFFLAWAEVAEAHFQSFDQAAWMAKFDDDLFNLNTAIRWLFQHDRVAEAMRLISAIGRPLEVRGYAGEVLEICRALLARGENSSAALAKMYLVTGRLAWTLDQYTEARSHFSECVRLGELLENEKSAALASGYLGFLDRGDGYIAEAEKKFNRCLEEGKRLNYVPAEALGLAGLGRVKADQGALEEGLALGRAALEKQRKIGDLYIVGLMLWGLARSSIAIGDTTTAESALKEWLQIARSLGNRWVMPYALQAFAAAACAKGNYARAARLLGASEAQRERFGFKLSLAEQKELEADWGKVSTALSPEEFAELRREGSELPTEQLDLLL